MPHYCTLIPGDGIGPEVAQAAVRAVEATGVDIVWRRAEFGPKPKEDLPDQHGLDLVVEDFQDLADKLGC